MHTHTVEPVAKRPAPTLAGDVAVVLLVTALFAASAWAGVELTRGEGRIAALWVPNALLLVVLMHVRAALAPVLLACAFVANILVNLSVGDPLRVALGLSLANQIEVMLILLALHRLGCPRPDFDRPGHILSFLVVAVIATGLSGSIALTVLGADTAGEALSQWWSWVRADALGMLIIVPALSILHRAWGERARLTRARLLEAAGLILLGTSVSVWTFWQSDYPFLFLDAPIVILYALRLGPVGNAIAIINLAIVASIATALGHGPINLVDGGIEEKIMVLQVFLTASFAIGLPIAAFLREREQMVAAKARFLATMSHEIRTPMNGVLGFADMLQATELTRTQRSYVDAIATSGETMVQLLNDILDYARIEAGSVTLRPERVDIAALAETCLATFAGLAGRKDVTLDLIVEDSVQRTIMIDPLRLRQILLNLLGNAVKFTERGGVCLRISQVQGHLQIAVRDTGVGIKPEDIRNVFKQFGQVDNAAQRRFGGTGLGLAITSQLVTLMGGTITVASTHGEGSCFTVTLKPVPASRVEPTPNGTYDALTASQQGHGAAAVPAT